ncbi:uncharacterized protein LOC123556853 isoform X2 [Mercenaria mercenaria]|uniref:uncharacterized protein LOC123556853 isoform X2 n=1 Tax=Mercenaria mercenaria TaxID=6596 RepID=UPI00234EBC2D|nr:uncharacterized protein LOC123556853 isoform X2 [Mercenaria mercenaria]
MGVDTETYRGRIGIFKFASGVDVIILQCTLNFSGCLKAVGSLVFIGILLFMAGIEQNPGPTEQDEEVTESADNKFKTYIDKAWGKLVDFMIPDPILNSSAFEFRERRDIMEEKNTSEKNRGILKKFRSKGAFGYKSLKTCLVDTKQMLLVKLLECIEKGEDASLLEKQLDDEVMKTTRKVIIACRNDLVEKYRKYYIKTEFIPWKPEEEQVDIDDVYSPVHVQRRVKSSGKKNIQQTNNYVEKLEQTESKSAGKQKINKNTNKLKLKIPIIDNVKQKGKPISSIHELFYYNNKRYKKILISAESGAGKTTLCRKLISLWCKQSVDSPETGACAAADELKEFIYVDDEDINTENESTETLKFDFLFYVSLRHAKQEEYIEDMIARQLQINDEVLQEILDTTNCLVLVDGLDEWSPQQHVYYGPMDIKGCPKEKHVGQFYSVFTTRPWKLVDEARDANKLELQCQLKGVQTYEEMIALYAKVIKDKTNFSTEKFLKDVRNKTEFLSTPLLLKLVMLLWAENGELEVSDCRLYGRVVELLIKSGLERNVNDSEFMRKVNEIHPFEEAPICFNKSEYFSHLQKYFSAIKQVAKVSFETLLKGTLLLKDTDVQLYTKKYNIDLHFLKKLGLFSQSPHIGGSFIDRESKVTFIQKSFQEFYAAVHIVSYPEDCYRIFREKWSKSHPESTNARFVVLSDVFKFVSGMDPSAMPKMYKLIYMYTFDDINSDQCHTDRTEKFKIYLRGRYGCIVKQKLARYACPIDKLLKTFNKHIIENVTEIFNCGHSDFKIHIPDLSLYFLKIVPSPECIEMLNMFKVLKYINPSSLKTLVLQYDAECDQLVQLLKIFLIKDDFCDMISALAILSGGRLPIWCNLWSGECSNLKEVKLRNISLTYEQMERVLLIHPSNLEIIILDNVECCSHKRVSEMCTYIEKGKSSEKFGFSEMQINEKIKGEHFAHVGFSEIKLSTTFVMLKELELKCIGVLTHSQVTHMLTDSPSLQSVSLDNVHCMEDGYCGCRKAVSGVGSEEAFCKYTSTASSAKQLSITNCSGILCHTNRYPQLEEFSLYSSNDKKAVLPLQILSHLTTFGSVQDVNMLNRSQRTENGSSDIGDNSEGRLELKTCCSEQKLKLSKAADMSISSRLHALHVVKLDNIEIGHSHITWILTLPNLEVADLSEVVCTADNMCGCYTKPGSLDLFSPSDPGTKCVESRLKEITICEGKEIFKHVSKLVKLRTLCFRGKIEKIDNVFLTGLNLKKLTFKHKEIPFNMCDYVIGPEVEMVFHCEISQELLIRFLDSISNSHLVILNRVVLTEGNADYVYETVGNMKNVHVQEFTKWKWLEPELRKIEIEPGWVIDDISDFALVETSSKANIVSMKILKKQQDLKDKDESD